MQQLFRHRFLMFWSFGMWLWWAVALSGCANSASSGNDSTGGSTGEDDGTTESSFIELETFQSASLVIGQPDFTSGEMNQGGAANADTLLFAPYAALYGERIYVADASNNRVLAYDAIPSENGAGAALVLGQSSFTAIGTGMSATGMSTPRSVMEDADGRLFVADWGVGRVLVFNNRPETNGAAADIVVGQASFGVYSFACDASTISTAEDVMVVDGKLIVTDGGHHRVLIWNSIPTAHGTPADLVLGQSDLESCSENQDGPPDADTMNIPIGIWSDGTHLAVADNQNQRVLIWTSFPTENGQPADIVLGQADFTTNEEAAADADSLNLPNHVYSNGTQLFVADSGNSRVLVWNSFPTENAQPADIVLGQGSFTTAAENDADQDGDSDAEPTASTLRAPTGVFPSGNLLFVADQINHRVLVFEGK